MFCPKCASPASEGQRFCRQCGTNLGLIVDAMDGKRGPVDYERLKQDLKDLGSSLRAGFEQAHQEIKKSNRHRNRHKHDFGWASDAAHKATTLVNDASTAVTDHHKEIQKSIEKKINSKMDVINKWRQPRSYRYHLQQAILKILTGGATAAVWYFLLNTAASSGLLQSLEKIVLQKVPDLTGLVPVVQMLWMLGLIPVAQGVGHLIAMASLMATKKDEPLPETGSPQYLSTPDLQVDPIPSTPKITNEIQPDFANSFSVTEEPTVPLGPRKQERQAS